MHVGEGKLPTLDKLMFLHGVQSSPVASRAEILTTYEATFFLFFLLYFDSNCVITRLLNILVFRSDICKSYIFWSNHY